MQEIKTFEEREEELLKQGKEKGFITYEELAAKLKGLEIDSDLLDELYNTYSCRIMLYEPDLNLLNFVLHNVDISEILSSGRVYISNDIDEFINKLQLTSPEQSQLLEILNVILDGYDSLDVTNDNGKYEKSVQRIINNSQIPKSSKDKLNDAVSVANASSRLWNVNFK